MKIDLTYLLTKVKLETYLAQSNSRDKGLASLGHIGTHFDAMERVFPLDYSECRGVIFDVSNLGGRDIELSDIDKKKVSAGDFVLIFTGTSARHEYGDDAYSKNFPQISWELIEFLLAKKVHIIGVDCRGLRKGNEHHKADELCVNNDAFVVENLVRLDEIISAGVTENFKVHTYPLNLLGFSGIPCRVVAEI